MTFGSNSYTFVASVASMILGLPVLAYLFHTQPDFAANQFLLLLALQALISLSGALLVLAITYLLKPSRSPEQEPTTLVQNS